MLTLAQTLDDIHREAQRDANARWVMAIAVVVLVAFVVLERLWERRQERKERDPGKRFVDRG